MDDQSNRFRGLTSRPMTSTWRASSRARKPSTHRLHIRSRYNLPTAQDRNYRTLVDANAGHGTRKEMGLDPWDVTKHEGLLQAISTWLLETARVPVPQFATIAALSFLSAFFGRRYVTPTELGLNTF